MDTVILVRHGRTTANASGLLAGRTPGVSLDDVGRDPAAVTGIRLAVVPLVGVVSSPLKRRQQTPQFILDRQTGKPEIPVDDGIAECDYGQWQSGTLTELAIEPLWSTARSQPSAATFPGSELRAAV